MVSSSSKTDWVIINARGLRHGAISRALEVRESLGCASIHFSRAYITQECARARFFKISLVKAICYCLGVSLITLTNLKLLYKCLFYFRNYYLQCVEIGLSLSANWLVVISIRVLMTLFRRLIHPRATPHDLIYWTAELNVRQFTGKSLPVGRYCALFL